MIPLTSTLVSTLVVIEKQKSNSGANRATSAKIPLTIPNMKLITVSSLLLAFLSSVIATTDLDSRSDTICVHGHDCTTDSPTTRTHAIGKHKIEATSRTHAIGKHKIEVSKLRRNVVKRNKLSTNCPEESKNSKTGEIAQDAEVNTNGCTVTVDNSAGTGFTSTEKLQQLNGTMDGVQMLKMEYGEEKSDKEEEEEKEENIKNGCPPDCSLCVQGMCRDSGVKKVDAIKEANQEDSKSTNNEAVGERNNASKSGVNTFGVLGGVAIVGLLSAFL